MTMAKQTIKIARARPTPKFHFRQRRFSRKAFCITELMVGAVASVIVVLSVGFTLADSHRAWHRTYDSAHGDLVVDGFVARRAFDSVIRKASSTGYSISEDGDWVTIQYYSDPEATTPDRYASFKRAGSDLDVEVGTLDPPSALTVRTICGNVSECTFKLEGSSVQMILVLDNGKRSITLVACGYMHN